MFVSQFQDKVGRNALHCASRNGHESLARDLITMYELRPNTAEKVRKLGYWLD